MPRAIFLLILLFLSARTIAADDADSGVPVAASGIVAASTPDSAAVPPLPPISLDRPLYPDGPLNGRRRTLYDYPYSRTRSMPDWHQLAVNTAILIGGGITTMVILESLPDGSTAWSRAERRQVPLFKRWVNHVKAGPVWDHDKFIFNYVLHPYGGAAYYMSARSCGFNMWGSFLYSFAISTLFWEYGFEAFNEIPSVQDLVITPVVGTVVGECFYRAKRSIVSRRYELLGSPVLGYIAAFFLDPVNEVVSYFRKDQYHIWRNSRRPADEPKLTSSIWVNPGGMNPGGGLSLKLTF
ncbi:MAG: DUF3943 domain-containing protein [Candidatus Amulumruptor sp.]|nr:DUF3943 domain-containing protein [Candidatus Amulumruptor sp.]